jgi:hypothetical protein
MLRPKPVLLLLALGLSGLVHLLRDGPPEDTYSVPPPDACGLLDTDHATEIAGNGPHLRVSGFGHGDDSTSCIVSPGSRSPGGHRVRLTVLVFPSGSTGGYRSRWEVGADEAEDSYERRERRDGLVPSTCPGGEEILGRDPSGDGNAAFRHDNLVMIAGVELADGVQGTLGARGRARAAEDLLCDAIESLHDRR